MNFLTCFIPLMPGGKKGITYIKVTHMLSAEGFFKYVWPFCYHQALKG